MMRTLDASRLQILRGVEIPSALPYFFSGAKIAVAVAVIGAVFGEWRGLGLGPRTPDPAVAQRQLQTARTFAAVVVLSALAIAPVRAARAARATDRLVAAAATRPG